MYLCLSILLFYMNDYLFIQPKRHSVCLGDSDWTSVYMSRIDSPQSCINEWNTMPDVTVSGLGALP